MAVRRRSLRELDDDVWEARARLHEAIGNRFRPRDRVHVTWGEHEVPAEVLDVSGDSVRVRSLRSGKKYWVEATRLVEFARL